MGIRRPGLRVDRSSDERRGRAHQNFLLNVSLGVRSLRRNLSDHGVDARVDKLSIILAHGLRLYNSAILDELCEARRQEQHLYG